MSREFSKHSAELRQPADRSAFLLVAKRLPCLLRAASLFALLATAIEIRAQTVAISNLGQSATGQVYFGYDGTTFSSVGVRFTTGTSSQTLTGVSLAFVAAQGTPTGLTANIYNSFSSGSAPSGLVATLTTATNPTSAGTYSFSGSATLNASSTYYLILSAPTTATNNNYAAQRTSSSAEDSGGISGWSIGDNYILNNSDFTWVEMFSGPPMMSVSVSAIPEPSTYAAICGAAVLGLAAWRRRKSRSRTVGTVARSPSPAAAGSCVLALLVSSVAGGFPTPAQAQAEAFTFSTYAGKIDEQGSANGPAAQARFGYPEGIAVDSAGTVYVADTVNNAIRRISPSGEVSTLAGSVSEGTADGVGANARFNQPRALAVDSTGTLLVADTGNDRIRRITPAGVVTTVATNIGAPYGIAIDGSGNAYVTSGFAVLRISPSGVVGVVAGARTVMGTANGTGTAARFSSPYGIALDRSGALYVTDSDAVRMITASGVVSTLAGRLSTGPNASFSGGNNSGSADGTGDAARFNGPSGIALDKDGVLWIADRKNGTIRRVTSAGVVTTVGGTPPASTSRDGVGADARFSDASSIAVDASGVLYITDTDSNAIRKGVRVPTNNGGSGSSANPGRIVNMSILTAVGAAGESFTVGTVIGGSGTSGTKPLLVRAVGPSLAAFGVSGALDDPKLELFTGTAKVGENDNWGGSAALAAASAQVGAFALAGPTSRDAVLLAPALGAGGHSAVISGVGASSGPVILELYDASAPFTATTPRLVNVSVLKNLGTGLTAGFVIGGATGKTVLVRAVGPGLAPFGVTTAVSDPQLALFSGSTRIGENDNWGGTAALKAAFGSVAAFALPDGSRDAALVATLQPGNYTVQVSGVGGTTGTALVEVYEVP